MSRVFVPITLNELKKKVDDALGEDGYDYRHLTPVIEKDLDKVNFSTENLEAGNGSVKDLVGYHMLSNGMPILGISAGGDWEYPIFFCIYFDGKKLRAYIPEKGNTWNTDTKKAYGNDTVADLKNARKRWPVQYPPDLEVDEDEDVEPIGNTDEMAKDIMDRIVRKTEPPKNVVVKLTLEPGGGWDKNAIETLIKASNGCNIPGLGNVYQGTRVIAQITKIEVK
jgi:hypothetical protein